MISPEQIDQARAVSIVELLAARHFKPAGKSGRELVYHSPLRTDRNPSFYVDPTKNVFRDSAHTEHRGDAIRLVMALDKVGFRDAVSHLLGTPVAEQPLPSFFSGGSIAHDAPATEPTEAAIELILAKPLQHPALLAYVQSRGISPAVAQCYTQEVHYLNKGKAFFAVGFANDAGGFALRSEKFKGNIAPTGHTTISGLRLVTANVFEGFFDFLSAVQLFGPPSNATIVLNSTTNLAKAIPLLRSFDSLNLYLDRDKAGFDAVARLKKEGLTVFDRSTRYEGFNDLNQFLVTQ